MEDLAGLENRALDASNEGDYKKSRAIFIINSSRFHSQTQGFTHAWPNVIKDWATCAWQKT
jgi:hypothetical protein